jgi:hypothetical protein
MGMLDRLAAALLPRVAPGQFFSPVERRVMTAAAETMLDGAGLPLTPERVARNVEEFLLCGRSRRAWRIRVLCLVIEWAPLVFLAARSRFSRLTPAARRALVARRYVGGRGVWSLCGKIRHLVYLGAYGDERANPAVGFVPWPLRARSRQRQGRATGG